MKPLYVLNLNSTRILIIAGVSLIVAGGSFWAGMKIPNKNSKAINNEFGVMDRDHIQKNNLSRFQNFEEDLYKNENSKNFQKKSNILAGRDNSNSNEILPPSLSNLNFTQNKDGEILVVKEDPLNRRRSNTRRGKIRKRATQKKSSTNERKIIKGVYYTIQVAAFKKETDALKLKKKLKKKGVKARVDKGIRFYFVRVGRSKSQDLMKKAIKKIKTLVNVKPLLIKTKVS